MIENRKKGRNKVAYFISGVLAGVANGLFGGGAGMLVVPSLRFFGGLDEKKSHASAIAIVTPLSFLSTLVYSVKGETDFSLAWKVGVGVVVGGLVGALLLRRIPKTLLTVIFYAVMIYSGVRMLV